jgi:hypothetical protein
MERDRSWFHMRALSEQHGNCTTWIVRGFTHDYQRGSPRAAAAPPAQPTRCARVRSGEQEEQDLGARAAPCTHYHARDGDEQE